MYSSENETCAEWGALCAGSSGDEYEFRRSAQRIPSVWAGQAVAVAHGHWCSAG